MKGTVTREVTAYGTRITVNINRARMIVRILASAEYHYEMRFEQTWYHAICYKNEEQMLRVLTRARLTHG